MSDPVLSNILDILQLDDRTLILCTDRIDLDIYLIAGIAIKLIFLAQRHLKPAVRTRLRICRVIIVMIPQHRNIQEHRRLLGNLCIAPIICIRISYDLNMRLSVHISPRKGFTIYALIICSYLCTIVPAASVWCKNQSADRKLIKRIQGFSEKHTLSRYPLLELHVIALSNVQYYLSCRSS